MTNTSKKLIEDSYLFFKNNKIVLNDLGLELIERDIGTGYHIPEGILLTFGNESKDLLKNYEILDTTLIAPLILKYFNLKPKKYMKKVK